MKKPCPVPVTRPVTRAGAANPRGTEWKEAFLSPWQEQRRFRRVQLEITARFLTEGGKEEKGQILDMSAGGIAITSDLQPAIGEKIVLYVDSIGGFEGAVSRHLDQGFAVQFKATPAKHERTVDQLTWLLNKPETEELEERRFERMEVEKNATLHRSNGTETPCRIIDMSLGGLAIEIADRPPIGEIIAIGRMEGRVVRHFGSGVGIEFIRIPRHQRKLTEALF